MSVEKNIAAQKAFEYVEEGMKLGWVQEVQQMNLQRYYQIM